MSLIPTPVPTPTPYQQPTNWNSQWNSLWNQAWNEGYNQGGRKSYTQYGASDPSLQSAIDQGYGSGLNQFRIGGTGASTSTPSYAPSSSGGGTSVPSQPSGPSPEELARQSYFGELDKQLGAIPGIQSNLESQVNNSYGTSKSGIQSGLDTSLSGLDLSRQNIATNQANSLRDLAGNMKNQLMAGNIYLGARGAADSSGADQYSLALAREGSKIRSGVNQQATGLQAQVDQQSNQLRQVAQDQFNQLDTWKNNQLLQISSYIQSLKGNIDQYRANYIQNQLSQLDQQVSGYKQAVAQWVLDRSTSLDQVQSQFKQLGVSPNTNISSAQLPGINSPLASNFGGVDLYGSMTKKPNDFSSGYYA